MTTFTPKRVIHPSSDNASEILVVCEDEKGKPRNITIVDKKLGPTLAATPAMLPNPEYQPLVDRALAKAAEKIAADEKAAAEEAES